jgi:hypothetical protein
VAQGADARLSDDTAAALAAVNPPADLTPRTVQAYLAGRLAAGFGQRLLRRSVNRSSRCARACARRLPWPGASQA